MSLLALNETQLYFYNWFHDRNLQIWEHQQRILNNDFTKLDELIPLVIGAVMGAGKTITSIAGLDKYLMDNPLFKVLVLAHGTKVLRTQYATEVEKMKPGFTHATVETSSEFMNAYENNQVVITLPQTIYNLNKLPRFDLVVVDEAHQFYLTRHSQHKKELGMVMHIIDACKPKHQLLLTGTPFIFNNPKYNVTTVTMGELYALGLIAPLAVDLATSAYDYTYKDYNEDAELLTSVSFKDKDTIVTLDKLLPKIVQRLKSLFNNHSIVHGTMHNVLDWTPALKTMRKTMFVCRSQMQAKQVKEYFDAKGVNSALSISDTDTDSLQIERFRYEQDCIILIVVDRGTLGFSMNELMYIVDLSGTLNIIRLFQLIGRLTRKSADNAQKLFFKVMPPLLEEYTMQVLSAVLYLTEKEGFEKFNGRNFLDLPIIYVPVKRTRKGESATTTTTRKPRTDTYRMVEIEGLPSVKLFTSIYHKNDKILNIVGTTTLREVRNLLFRIYKWKRNQKDLFNQIDAIANEGKCDTLSSLNKYDKDAYRALANKDLLSTYAEHRGWSCDVIRSWAEDTIELFSQIDPISDAGHCDSLKSLARYDAGAYSVLSTRGLTIAYAEHRGWGVQRLWTEDTIELFSQIDPISDAGHCDSLKSLNKYDSGAYQVLMRRELDVKYAEHRHWVYIKKPHKIRTLWAKDTIELFSQIDPISDAGHCDSLKSLALYDNNAYQALCRRGLKIEYAEHRHWSVLNIKKPRKNVILWADDTIELFSQIDPISDTGTCNNLKSLREYYPSAYRVLKIRNLRSEYAEHRGWKSVANKKIIK
jgi:superfamily II DNA or RNA helicase